MLSLQSYLRKGVSLGYVGLNQNLKDLKDLKDLKSEDAKGRGVCLRARSSFWIHSNTPLGDHRLADCREPSAQETWILEILDLLEFWALRT